MQEKKTAVALEYETGEKAPKVVASGRGYLADKIVEVAKESDVPVHKDAKLARSLSVLDIGEYIPPELYSVVAEVLVFVDNMDRIQEKIKRKQRITGGIFGCREKIKEKQALFMKKWQPDIWNLKDIRFWTEIITAGRRS